MKIAGERKRPLIITRKSNNENNRNMLTMHFFLISAKYSSSKPKWSKVGTAIAGTRHGEPALCRNMVGSKMKACESSENKKVAYPSPSSVPIESSWKKTAAFSLHERHRQNGIDKSNYGTEAWRRAAVPAAIWRAASKQAINLWHEVSRRPRDLLSEMAQSSIKCGGIVLTNVSKEDIIMAVFSRQQK